MHGIIGWLRVKRARHQRIVRGRDFSKIQKKKNGLYFKYSKKIKLEFFVFFFCFLRLLKNKSREQKMGFSKALTSET